MIHWVEITKAMVLESERNMQASYCKDPYPLPGELVKQVSSKERSYRICRKYRITGEGCLGKAGKKKDMEEKLGQWSLKRKTSGLTKKFRRKYRTGE